MSFDEKRLWELLPTIVRLRDGEGADSSKNALRALVEVIAGQVAVLEEDLAQLYDDQFVETCAEWVAPYIGDLVGYRTLYGLTDRIGSPRAEVANTIAYRRRKGTASMLEQLARDVTGWDARVVEYFRLLATTQYMNHVRSNGGWAGLRDGAALARIGTPFDEACRTADVRRIGRRRGRFNIPNVGLHVFRIRDVPLTGSPAAKLVPGDPTDRRYLFSPLGHDMPLYNGAVAEERITHIAERENVPLPISRRELWDDLGAFYPASLAVRFGGVALPASAVAASDLSDAGGGWAYSAADRVLVDPALGRLSLPPSLVVDGHAVPMEDPTVDFHYGFTADLGGGTYPRLATLSDDLTPVIPVVPPGTISGAIAALPGSGVVEVRGNGRYEETLSLTAPPGARIELRAADGSRPAVLLGGELVIDLADDAEVTLNGLLLAGARLRVPAGSGRGTLRLRHCTLVPGLALNGDGTPRQPGAPSLVVESDTVSVQIDHSILGGLLADPDASVAIASSLVDATDPSLVAYAAPDGAASGGELTVVASTLIGKVNARVLRLVSNSILHARLSEGDPWARPVDAERRQEGCVRFSYVPPGSRTPRRHRCVPSAPADALRVQPQFTSERYGAPGYGQLSDRAASEIRTGADDESEMGAFHDLFNPQRETNLNVRLEEYLRFGLEAGVFHAS